MWHEGARSGGTDWNTLRHYSQKHAMTAHNAVPFKRSSVANGSWRAAFDAFVNGAEVVDTYGDDEFHIPEFRLRKVS